MRMRSAPPPARRGAICSSPAIGPAPDCPLPSRGRSAPAIAPPISLAESSGEAAMLIDQETSAASRLDRSIEAATRALMSLQRPDGHWVFELEADATIPAEYVLLRHYLGTPEPEIEQHIARYLRASQGRHGGWQLFYGGAFDLSASVKAYFALKAAGDSIDAPHMVRA